MLDCKRQTLGVMLAAHPHRGHWHVSLLKWPWRYRRGRRRGGREGRQPTMGHPAAQHLRKSLDQHVGRMSGAGIRTLEASVTLLLPTCVSHAQETRGKPRRESPGVTDKDFHKQTWGSLTVPHRTSSPGRGRTSFVWFIKRYMRLGGEILEKF